MSVEDDVLQWKPLALDAQAKHGVPYARTLATIAIESNGNPRAIQRNPQNGDSFGLMQVVPYGTTWAGHHALVKQVMGNPNATRAQVREALLDPRINLVVGARILQDNYVTHGTWDKASSAFFLGNPEWDGRDTVNGNTGAWYRNTLNDWITRLESGGVADQWRPYPYPPMVNVHVVKPYDGAGFDRVAPRGPRIVGSCNHITDGRGSIEWYRDFFSTGGERARDALTDTVIGRDGRIGLLNDWRDPDWGGRRAGWANGTSTGIEGDGVAFYRNYPLINDVLVSKEHEGRAGEAMTSAQMVESVELSTAVAQSVKCPWDTYPYHPGKKGVNIEMMHYLFAPKSCPAEPFISTYYPQLIKAVRENLREWQGGVETPPPEPELPPTYSKWGMSEQQMSWFFGVMTRQNPDGSSDELPFSPKGPLSLLWMNRCEKEGVFPEAASMASWDANLATGKEWYATWQNGWTAWLPVDDKMASWRWIN